MRAIIAIIILSINTSLLVAAPSEIGVSPDGRYVVRFIRGKQKVPAIVWHDNAVVEYKAKEWDVASLVLLDRKNGDKIGLVNYDPQGGPLPTHAAEFKALWSSDGRHLAISYPKNARTEQLFDEKRRIFSTINRHPDTELAVFLVTNGRREFVELPAPKIFDILRRSHAQKGQVIDHWEKDRVLWSSDARRGKFYRYQLR